MTESWGTAPLQSFGWRSPRKISHEASLGPIGHLIVHCRSSSIHNFKHLSHAEISEIRSTTPWRIWTHPQPRQPRQPWRCFAAGALSCCCLGWLYACRSLGSRRSSLMQDGRIKCRSVYLYGTCCMLVHVCTILKSCACIVQLYVKDLKDCDVTHVKAFRIFRRPTRSSNMKVHSQICWVYIYVMWHTVSGGLEDVYWPTFHWFPLGPAR